VSYTIAFYINIAEGNIEGLFHFLYVKKTLPVLAQIIPELGYLCSLFVKLF